MVCSSVAWQWLQFPNGNIMVRFFSFLSPFSFSVPALERHISVDFRHHLHGAVHEAAVREPARLHRKLHSQPCDVLQSVLLLIQPVM